MKGSIRFDDSANIEVSVDKNAAEGAKLLSAVNLADGQTLGGDSDTQSVKWANITWQNLPDTFDNYAPCSSVILIRTSDGYTDPPNIYGGHALSWDDEWYQSNKLLCFGKKAGIGDMCMAVQNSYYGSYKFIVVSGDAEMDAGGNWLEIWGDCIISLEADN